MYYDSHIHSSHSSDGKSELWEYAAAVDEGKLMGIGFAEHLDLMPECGSYGCLDYSLYMGEVKVLRDRGYEFFAGCEVDYNKKAENEILEHLNSHKYAFVMCSIHMVEGFSISNRSYVPSIDDLNKLLYITGRYYEEFKYSLGVEAFDVIGHVSVFKRYLRESFRNDEAMKRLIKEAEHEIAKICAESGKILEVNSSGLFSPLGAPLPDRQFLELYYEYGGRNVCAGSDAHCVKDAGKGIEEVYILLRETGFKYMMLPWDREHPVML